MKGNDWNEAVKAALKEFPPEPAQLPTYSIRVRPRRKRINGKLFFGFTFQVFMLLFYLISQNDAWLVSSTAMWILLWILDAAERK